MSLVSKNIHRLPKSIMTMHHELATRCQTCQRLVLQDAIFFSSEIASKFAFQEKESAIDDPLARLGLLQKALNFSIRADIELAETGHRVHS